MADYSQHPYETLLTFIENGCRKMGEDMNFAQQLLYMEKTDSVEDMVKIYNNICKIIAVIFYGTKKVPRNWYITNSWSSNCKDLIQELNNYFNTNLTNWLRNHDTPTNEEKCLCVSNYRGDVIYSEQLKLIRAKNNRELKHLLYIRNTHYLLRKEIESAKQDKEHLIDDYISYSKYLAAHGHIFDSIEIAFGKAHNIDYTNYATLYEKEREEEIRNEKKKRLVERISVIVILSLIMTSLFIGISFDIDILTLIGFYSFLLFMAIYTSYKSEKSFGEQIADFNGSIEGLGKALNLLLGTLFMFSHFFGKSSRR